MFRSAFPHRLRLLIAFCLAMGMTFCGFSTPLVRGSEAPLAASVATPPTPTCCCGFDGKCGMGCCVVQAPVAPDASHVPTSRSGERLTNHFVLDSATSLPSSSPRSVPHARHALLTAHLMAEPSLQQLQVRLEI